MRSLSITEKPQCYKSYINGGDVQHLFLQSKRQIWQKLNHPIFLQIHNRMKTMPSIEEAQCSGAWAHLWWCVRHKKKVGNHYIGESNTIMQPVFWPRWFSQTLFKLQWLTEERVEPGVSEALELELSHPTLKQPGKDICTVTERERRWWGLTRRGNGLVADQACFIYCMW